MTTDENDRSLRAVFGWAAYLGCSWTWCIGMFLPVLLLRDYGFWGWLIFAAPNVIGAAAMGTVLAAPGSSRRMIQPHRGAGIVFSIVTIGFHVFFLFWVVRGLIGPSAVLITGGIAAAFFLIGTRNGRDRNIALGVLSVSLVAFACFAIAYGAPPLQAALPLPRAHLVPLAVVCILGFTFCPYLDLTFHRARQSTAPVAGISAFVIGFGGMFLLMICFTLWYARLLIPGTWTQINRPTAWLIAGHLMVQSAFTVAVHLREVCGQWKSADLQVIGGTAGGLVLAATPITLSLFIRPAASFADPNELTYRLFMSFYALAFPAYVWFCMTPTPVAIPMSSSARFKMAALAVAVALAAPFYWVGFISGKMHWLLAGVSIIVVSRLFMAYRPLGRLGLANPPSRGALP